MVNRAGGAGAEGAEISAPLFLRLDTIFPTALLFVGVINHRIHLRDSFPVNGRDYVINQAFAASSKLLPLLLLANFHTQPASCLCQIVHNNTDYRKVRIMHQSMPQYLEAMSECESYASINAATPRCVSWKLNAQTHSKIKWESSVCSLPFRKC